MRDSSRREADHETQRQVVAGDERAAVPAADTGADVGRYAAEHRRDVEAALDRDVERGTARERADADDLAAAQPHAAHRLDRPAADRRDVGKNLDGRARAGERHPHVIGLDDHGRAEMEHLERAGLRRIAGERIGSAQRHRIERAADGDAEALVADAPEVLDRGQQSRPHDAQRRRHAASFAVSTGVTTSPAAAAAATISSVS